MHDIERSGGRSASLSTAAREASQTPSWSDPNGDAVGAGIASYIGAGLCNEHARVAQFVHAQTLAPGETVGTVTDVAKGHVFALTHAAEGVKVVLDAWSEGPAVNAEDAAYMTGYGARLSQVHSPYPTTVDSAPEAVAAFRRGMQEVGLGMQPRIDAAIRRNPPEQIARQLREEPLPSQIYAHPVPVVSEAFATRVAARLESVPTPDGGRVHNADSGAQHDPVLGLAGAMAPYVPMASRYVERSERDQRRRELVRESPELRAHAEVLNSVLAADAARSLGADIHGATQAAARIVDGAKDLRASDPSRPPSRPPYDGSAE
jgi:hypothetical protein